MKELTDFALDLAESQGADYADVRIVDQRRNVVYVRGRSVKMIEDTQSFGYSVRVLIDGAWGLASNTVLNKDDLGDTVRTAVETAKASGRVPRDQPSEMAPASGHQDTCEGPCEEDPFSIPNSEKADVLLQACSTMMDVENVVLAHGALDCIKMRRVIANTDGSYLDLTNHFTSPHLEATAVEGDESQSRSFQGGARQAGFEYVRRADLPGNAKKWAEQAVAKTTAEESPKGVMDLVLDPNNLALTMHESVGHPTESDRVLGWEANMAGRSFVELSDLGSLRYGSDLVNLTANNRLEDGVGSWFYDDDGVEMQKFPIVKDGILRNLSLTRETAPLLGFERSNGCCRADSFSHFPINRIPNLYMEPGEDDTITPEDLIADVERGVYIEGMGSFSIDQMRRNFQFGGDMFWLIENGKKVRPLKRVTYQAQTQDFWQSCDGIAGPDYWSPHGVMNCGKGEPMQVMFMTHGASYARFRGINVGGARL